MFEQYVVNSLITIKSQLKLIIKNNEDISYKLEVAEPEASKGQFSVEVRETVKKMILQFPLKHEADLVTLEQTLKEKDYYKCMVSMYNY